MKHFIKALSDLTHSIHELSRRKNSELEAFKSGLGLATKQDLNEMERRLVMLSAQQLETLLDNQTTQIGKIAKEQSDRFDALTEANKNLQTLIEAGGVSPAIETAAQNLQSALDNLDAAIPDAPAQ